MEVNIRDIESVGGRYHNSKDGYWWYREVPSYGLIQLNKEEEEYMFENTVEGQWLPDGKFEHRNDIRSIPKY